MLTKHVVVDFFCSVAYEENEELEVPIPPKSYFSRDYGELNIVQGFFENVRIGPHDRDSEKTADFLYLGLYYN